VLRSSTEPFGDRSTHADARTLQDELMRIVA
jgi:hypothetical protein